MCGLILIFCISLIGACGGGSSSNDNGGSNGASGGNFDAAKFESACEALCNKENTCENAMIDCKGNCMATTSEVQKAFAQVSDTGKCHLDDMEAKQQECAKGSCDALDACEKAAEQLCPSQ
jgi:hypothetical protein